MSDTESDQLRRCETHGHPSTGDVNQDIAFSMTQDVPCRYSESPIEESNE